MDEIVYQNFYGKVVIEEKVEAKVEASQNFFGKSEPVD